MSFWDGLECCNCGGHNIDSKDKQGRLIRGPICQDCWNNIFRSRN